MPIPVIRPDRLDPGIEPIVTSVEFIVRFLQAEAAFV